MLTSRSVLILLVCLGLSCSQSNDEPASSTTPQSTADKDSAADGNSDAESGSTGGDDAEPDVTVEAATPEDGDGEGETSVRPQGPQQLLSESEVRDGWIELFDGHSLYGWTANSSANWSVEDGEVRADDGDPGLLLTNVPFADFEFRCEFHLEAGGNSGVFLRTATNPADPGVDCYELNICDSHPQFPTGSLVARHRIASDVETDGEWHAFRVLAEGDAIRVWLDESEIVNFTDESQHRLASGRIGLQMNGGRIRFRNVVARPLGFRPIYDGKTLDGWRTVPGSKSTFEVVDGMLNITNGPGFLETEQQYGDFVLRVDAFINGVDLNGGVFFRALPGTAEAPSHGYEMQLNNGFADGDRTQPLDGGTGGIFRREPARWVVADDKTWMTCVLVAHGPHMATWVDGYLVATFTDERERHENPRRGSKVDPGHISLQGHDETTDIRFRRIEVFEYRDAAAD